MSNFISDKEIVDWLEQKLEKGGILLHSNRPIIGQSGLNIEFFDGSLRKAVSAMVSYESEKSGE